jgi:hypothetical protein
VMLILSLCDLTGNWSRPYEEAGYRVLRVDLQHGQDVRLLRHLGEPVHGILAAPPCTHFSRAGAHLWASKGQDALLEGLAVVDACLRTVAISRPAWWALENPIGRLKDYLGPPAWKFDPCDFGDPWTKRTWLWGYFTPPTPLFSAAALRPLRRDLVLVNRTDKLSGQGRGKLARSATPEGFARAFFEVNP